MYVLHLVSTTTSTTTTTTTTLDYYYYYYIPGTSRLSRGRDYSDRNLETSR